MLIFLLLRHCRHPLATIWGGGGGGGAGVSTHDNTYNSIRPILTSRQLDL